MTTDASLGFSENVGFSVGIILDPEPVTVIRIIALHFIHHGDGLQLFVLAVIFLDLDAAVLKRRAGGTIGAVNEALLFQSAKGIHSVLRVRPDRVVRADVCVTDFTICVYYITGRHGQIP